MHMAVSWTMHVFTSHPMFHIYHQLFGFNIPQDSDFIFMDLLHGSILRYIKIWSSSLKFSLMVITDRKADINKGSWDINSLLKWIKKRNEIFFWWKKS
jgi:hypothetical protein